MRTKLLALAHENVLAVILVGMLAIALLLVFAPSLVVGDTWMTLVSGREVARHGLPDRELLTVLGRGRRWTDQQWLAQLTTYGAWRAGGLALVVAVSVALVTLTFGLGVAAARRRGATPLACALVLLPVIVGAPWAWTVRAQVVALPLYVLTLWAVVSARAGVTRRSFLVLPVLAVWANLHGSVTLGALLVALAGVLAAARRDASLTARLTGLALSVGAVAAVFATPYSPRRIYDYYHLFFFDSPFEGLLNEWERTGLGAASATFWALGAVTLALCVHQRRRLSPLEWLVLAITFAGGVQAIRGIVWFVLAVLVILPNVLSGILGERRVLSARGANVALAGAVAAGVVAAAAVLLVRDDASLTTIWPRRALPVIAGALEQPGTLVWGTDRHADWLLWELPQLRGRLAFDVRFELYTRRQLEDTVRWDERLGTDWKRVAAPYRVVVLDAADRSGHLPDLAGEHGTRIAYRDDEIVVAVRSLD